MESNLSTSKGPSSSSNGVRENNDHTLLEGWSCRVRWFHTLDPMINKEAFSSEEDATIFAAQREVGNKWAKIAQLLPKRTDNAVKNRWHRLMKMKLMKQEEEEAANLVKHTEAMENSSAPPHQHHHFFPSLNHLHHHYHLM